MGKASFPAFFALTPNVSTVHCAILSLAIAFSVFQTHLRRIGTRQAGFYDGSRYRILRFILWMRTDTCTESLVAGASIFAGECTLKYVSNGQCHTDASFNKSCRWHWAIAHWEAIVWRGSLKQIIAVTSVSPNIGAQLPKQPLLNLV